MAEIRVYPRETVGRINPGIYGHFAEHLGECIYGGVWVGEECYIPHTGGLRDDVVGALRGIRPPAVRWPGGCFADDYHWQDGIGPPPQRPKRLNLHWGKVVENNEFGTHEFIRFCRAIGAEPYICGNVGSGSPRELRDWMEYCNYPEGTTLSELRAQNGSREPFAVRYWGIGNENWGCGGHLTPEDYCSEYSRFSTFLRAFGGTEPFLIACGPSGNDVEWTGRFFDKLFGRYARAPIHGFAAHYYCGGAGPDTRFSQEQWYELLQKASLMEELVVQQRAVMDGFDPQRSIGLLVDEWGAWHANAGTGSRPLLWQQSTMRDALVAALTLDIFNRHADKVVMANVAQIINVLQSVILTDGPEMLLTPVYHVYAMYADHQGASSVRMSTDSEDVTFDAGGERRAIPSLAGSASLKEDRLTLTVTNAHVSEAVETTVKLGDGARVTALIGEVLTHGDIHARNTFDERDSVRPQPLGLAVEGSEFVVRLAPASVTKLVLALR